MAAFVHEAGLLGQANEHAHVIEKIDHGQGEDDGEKPMRQGARQIQAQEELRGEREMRDEVGGLWQGGEAQRHAGRGDGDDADDDGRLEPHRQQSACEENAANGHERVRPAQIPKGDEGRLVRSDHAAVLHAYEGYEGAYAHHDGVLEIHGHRVDYPLADPGDGEQEEDHAGDEDGP